MPAVLTSPSKTKAAKAKGNRPAPQPAQLAPMLGETQVQFFLRASRALKNQFPSVNRRTVEILRTWCESQNGQELLSKAASQFPAAKFQHFGPRCVFLEHDIPESDDGERQSIHYGQKQLEQLVNWANYRIRDSHTFAALSDGHTPSKDERASGSPNPEVLGYCGPFYVGMLGDVDPKWAIYADEWVHVSDVPRFEKLQRRSPEVWANEPMERRTMDPIAALGAETPRLDSGMNPYTRASDGQTVMRYSAMAFPGAFNTFVPSSGKKKRDTTHKYSGDAEMPLPGLEGQDNQQPDLAEAIGSALQSLMPSIVNAVMEQMNAGTDGNPPGDEPDGSDAEGAAVPRGMEGGQDDQNDADVSDQSADPNAPTDQPEQPAAGPAPAPGADDQDPEAKKYAAMGPQCYEAYKAGKASAMKYSRNNANGANGANSVNNELVAAVGRLQTQVKTLQAESAKKDRDVVRYSRLNELSREFAFDAREEFETIQDHTDDQFDRHCEKTITKYAKRDDLTGLDLVIEDEPERYARGGSGASRVSKEQVERYSREAATSAANKNAQKKNSTTFEAEFEAICKKHGVVI